MRWSGDGVDCVEQIERSTGIDVRWKRKSVRMELVKRWSEANGSEKEEWTKWNDNVVSETCKKALGHSFV